MPPTYVNKHGRQPHRGLRPWLLLPKVLLVGMSLGGLTAVLLLLVRLEVFPSTVPGEPADDLQTIAFLYRWLILPAATGSGLLGIALWCQMPWIFLRQRWFQVKMGLLLLLLPPTHLGCLWAASRQRPALLMVLAVLGALLLLAVIVIGRLKPRLGQNWARDWPAG